MTPGGREPMLEIETVAVVGAGDAAHALAIGAALAGCAVRLHEPFGPTPETASDAIRGRVERACAAGTLTPDDRQRILDGVLITADLEEAVTSADLVVAAGDGAPLERAAELARVAELVRATAALAAARPVAETLAPALPQPGRVVALALEDRGGPVPRVLVSTSGGTSAHVLDAARAWAARLALAAGLAP